MPRKIVANDQYIAARNQLIPEASRLASEETGARQNTIAWGQAFFRQMDRLWREKVARTRKFVAA